MFRGTGDDTPCGGGGVVEEVVVLIVMPYTGPYDGSGGDGGGGAIGFSLSKFTRAFIIRRGTVPKRSSGPLLFNNNNNII